MPGKKRGLSGDASETEGGSGMGEESNEPGDMIETGIRGEGGDSKRQRIEETGDGDGDRDGRGGGGRDSKKQKREETEEAREDNRADEQGTGASGETKKQRRGEREERLDRELAEETEERNSASLRVQAGGPAKPSGPPDTATFLSIVKEGGAEDVKKLLGEGADLNARTKEGWSALHIAADREQPSPEIVQILVEAGVDVKAVDKEGWSAVHVAATRKQPSPETIKALVEGGVDIKAVTKDGASALHLSVLYGHPRTVATLLEEEADVTAVNNNGWPPLHCAANREEPSLEIVKILVEAAADVKAVDKNGRTALHLAAGRDDHLEGLIKTLVEVGVDITVVDETGRTALHSAALQGHPQTVAVLLEAGADAKAVDKVEWPALHHAVLREQPSPEIVKMLVEAGADVKAVNERGDSVLHSAALYAHPVAVMALLEAGVDVKTANEDGCLALHRAAIRIPPSPDIVRMLVEAGTVVEAKDEGAETALHKAARTGHPQTVEALLEMRADVNAEDNVGWPALFFAVSREEPSPELVRMLVEAGADVKAVDEDGYSALHVAAKQKLPSPEIIKMLVEAGVDTKAVDEDGETALHFAAGYGHPLAVSALLEAGADVNAVDDSGFSALLSAVDREQPSPEIIKMLAEAGADLKAVDKDEWSALHFAARRKNPSIEIIRALVEVGVDIEAVDKDGNTALHCAAAGGHPRIVAALLEASANVNAVRKDGLLALFFVTNRRESSPEIVRLLKEAGADMKAVDKNGRSALHMAIRRSEPSLETIKALVEPGVDVKVLDKRRKTAADYAPDRPDIVQYLRRAGEIQDAAERWSLRDAAACFRACLLRARRPASLDPSPSSVPRLTETDGLWGLPVEAWGEMVRILRLIGVKEEEHMSGGPPLGAASLSPPVAAAAAAAAASVSPASLRVRTLSSLLSEGMAAVQGLKEALNHADAFRALQGSLRERVEEGNSRYLSHRDREVVAEAPCPIAAEETIKRDTARLELQEALRASLRLGNAASESLRALAERTGDSSPSVDRVSVEVLAEHLEKACTEMSRGDALPPPQSDSFADLSFAQLCKETLCLADEWVEGRKAAVRELRSRVESARKNFAERLFGDVSLLPPEERVCAELESAEKAQTEVHLQMQRLDDAHSSRENGKGVVKQIVRMCVEVLRRLREVIGLSDLIETAEKEAGQTAQGVCLYEEGGGSESPLARPLSSLSGFLREHEQQKKNENRLELKIALARVEEDEEEARKLEIELRVLRESSNGRDLPASIARERARLLSLASLHFPELLWEGGTFLPLVRLDVQQVVRTEAPSMLERGLLVQGRICSRDFTNETLISEPSPQSGRFARVTACSDLQGGQWVLKRYEIGGAGGSRYFHRQAAMLQDLLHPHLVHVTAVWQEGAYGFLQMPRYPGGDLAAWMDARPAEGGRDSRESLRLAEDLLSALAFLHQRGKVHCDVKPNNIFLTAAGRGVLGDLDGVKDVNPAAAAPDSVLLFPVAATTCLHTTSGYVAPEVKGGGRMTPAGDVFAAGVVLQELLGGGVLEGEPERAEAFREMLGRMRSDDPSARPSASEALQSRLFSREMAETAQCVACYEVLLCSRGVSCTAPSPHFLCAECLNRHVEALTRIDQEYSDVRARFKAGDCQVTCVHIGCPSEPFTAPVLSRHLNRETHALREGARVEASEERVRREMEEEYREKLRKALMEDGAQRRVRDITEDILTLKCPRCRAAFLDFANCAALTCRSCNCGFCGYCLKNCGSDAHDHVPRCPVAREVGARLNMQFGMFPGSVEDWERFQKERQTDRVREVLGSLNAEERNKVTQLLQPLLQERRIHL